MRYRRRSYGRRRGYGRRGGVRRRRIGYRM